MMKSKCLQIVSAVVVAGWLALVNATAGYAATGQTRSDSAAGEPKIPATADGIWAAIDLQTAALRKSIDTGALDQIHHHAFAIRDLVAALATHPPLLSADKRAKVQQSAKYVATLADRLDAAGDAKDLAGTKTHFAKLPALLKAIRANYATRK